MNLKTPALIAALSLTATAGFAESSTVDDYRTAKADVKALSAQLETMGVSVDDTVDFNGPTTFAEKQAAYEMKAAELQEKFNKVNQSN